VTALLPHQHRAASDSGRAPPGLPSPSGPPPPPGPALRPPPLHLSPAPAARRPAPAQRGDGADAASAPRCHRLRPRAARPLLGAVTAPQRTDTAADSRRAPPGALVPPLVR
jgi:hypothetical protein